MSFLKDSMRLLTRFYVNVFSVVICVTISMEYITNE